MNGSTRAALLLPALMLAACGDKKDESGATANIAIATSLPSADPGTGGDEGGMTDIDAATGDARRMPADSSGPTAYDRDKSRESPPPEQREEKAENIAEAAPPQTETPPAAD